MTIDEIAMYLGYALMIGSGSLVAGTFLCWGLFKLFWAGGEETFAFLRYIRWISQGRKRAPTDKEE